MYFQKSLFIPEQQFFLITALLSKNANKNVIGNLYMYYVIGLVLLQGNLLPSIIKNTSHRNFNYCNFNTFIKYLEIRFFSSKTNQFPPSNAKPLLLFIASKKLIIF